MTLIGDGRVNKPDKMQRAGKPWGPHQECDACLQSKLLRLGATDGSAILTGGWGEDASCGEPGALAGGGT